ncbi:MAG: hypothetical protein MJY83_07965 [Bacteroidales bacterium]|nr:hypothetical protein [Bacteroidales bacterium]
MSENNAIEILSAREINILSSAELILCWLAEQKRQTESIMADIKDKLYSYMVDHDIDEISCGDGVYMRMKETISFRIPEK